MDINTILLVLAAVGCPIIMGLIMWMMMRDTSRQSKEAPPAHLLSEKAADRLAALQQQRQALEAEFTEVTRIAELESKREQLTSNESLAFDRHYSDTGVQGKPVKAG